MKQVRNGTTSTVALSLALCMVAPGCGEESPGTSSEAASQAKSSPARKDAAGPATLAAGETAICENLEVALLSLKRADVHTKDPREGQGYAVLRFRVKNVGDEEEFGLIGRSLNWKDPADGNRTGPEVYTGVPMVNPENLKLAPGAQAVFEDVYMIPETLTEAEFQYLKGYNPQPLAVWKIAVD